MAKSILFFSAFVANVLMLVACSGNGSTENTEESKEVTIGRQVWMSKNLNVEKFRNGDPIPNAITFEEWEKAGKNGQPAWCYLNNDAANGEKFGKLYNWYAVNDLRGLAPVGWHIPSKEEWNVLVNYLGGEQIAGYKIKSTTGWNDNDNGNNASGFTGLPAGQRLDPGPFSITGVSSTWWSSTEFEFGEDREDFAYGFGTMAKKELWESGHTKPMGYSVRCIKD
jgi:uncharacterized protein (TIGR02145 family)